MLGFFTVRPRFGRALGPRGPLTMNVPNWVSIGARGPITMNAPCSSVGAPELFRAPAPLLMVNVPSSLIGPRGPFGALGSSTSNVPSGPPGTPALFGAPANFPFSFMVLASAALEFYAVAV